MCDGVYQLVFLSPEALLSNETWRDTVPSPVYQENLVAVVIDEFYQHSCHVTLGSNVTNYIPLWNENLAHVTRRIFPSLPPPPFPRACAPRGKIRMACETMQYIERILQSNQIAERAIRHEIKWRRSKN